MNDDSARDRDGSLSRRGALTKLGGLAAVALGVGALGARELLDADDADEAGAGPAAVEAGLVTCVLAPEQTEGPYYVDDAAVRRNVTEGKPGVAAHASADGRERLELQADQGRGRRDLALRRGRRLLRRRQGHRERALPARRAANRREGPRRLPHHLPRLVPGHGPCTSTRWCTSAGTSCTRASSTSRTPSRTPSMRGAPTTSAPNRDPRNSGDSIYRNGGKRSTLKLARAGSAYTGSITMGVQRS